MSVLKKSRNEFSKKTRSSSARKNLKSSKDWPKSSAIKNEERRKSEKLLRKLPKTSRS